MTKFMIAILTVMATITMATAARLLVVAQVIQNLP